MTSATATPLPAFELRCRDAEWIDADQTLEDFSRPTPLPAHSRNAGLGEALVADLVARSHYEIDELAAGRTIVSCQMPRYGIPLGVQDLDRPPTQAWNMREELRGELIDLDADRRPQHSVGMQVRRGLIAVAGALPLLVGATPAFASPAAAAVEGAAQVQQLEQDDAPPPNLPADQKAAAEGDTEAAAEGDTQPAPTAAPAAAPPPTPQPAADPAARVSGNSLSINGMVVWEGLLGKIVRLELKDGNNLPGTIVAQSAADLAVARSSDGMVVSVPKAQVASVRMRPQQSAGTGAGGVGPIGDRPREDGRGLAAGGIVMISLGSILALTGTVFLAISPSYVITSLPFLLPGLGMVGGGAAMVSAGAKKKRKFHKAWGIPTAGVELTPTLAASRQGGQVGLVLRF